MALYIVTGPPGCGKSTWVRNTAKPGDIRFGGDELTNAITGKTEDKHHHDNTTAKIARAAREAGIREAIKHRNQIDIYILKSNLNREDEAKWRRLGAQFIIIDPGYDVALQRCRDHRPGYKHKLVDSWYGRRDEWPKDAQIINPDIIQPDDGDATSMSEPDQPAPNVPRLPKRAKTTTERGYGWRHQQDRDRLMRRHRDGSPCWWCRLPMHGDRTKTKNWDGRALAADHSDESAQSGGRADRLLHGTCNSQRQDGSNDYRRPAVTGKHPSEPLGGAEASPAAAGFDFGGVSFA